MGTVYGSHSSNKLLSFTSAPFFTNKVDPYGALNEETRVLLLSNISSSVVLLIIISFPDPLTTDLRFLILTLPSLGDSKFDYSAEELATPPTWNDLIVN